MDYGWYALNLDNPEASASSGSIVSVGSEEGKLSIIQGENAAVAFSPALFFGERSNYLLRSEGLLVDSE